LLIFDDVRIGKKHNNAITLLGIWSVNNFVAFRFALKFDSFILNHETSAVF